MIDIVRLAVGTLIVACTCWAGAAAGDDAPAAPVLRFQDSLIAVMKEGEALGFAGRRERLAPVVDDYFDVPRISRAVIGRHFDSLSADERSGLSDRVRAYAIATLASRFRHYDGERFEPPVERARQGAQARMHSSFVASDGDRTALDFDLREDGGRWRIVNVWFDGVSGTDIQRAEFETFLRSGGAARLAQKLDELIASLGQSGG